MAGALTPGLLTPTPWPGRSEGDGSARSALSRPAEPSTAPACLNAEARSNAGAVGARWPEHHATRQDPT